MISLSELADPFCRACSGALEAVVFRDGPCFRCIKCDARYGPTTSMQALLTAGMGKTLSGPRYKAKMPREGERLGEGCVRIRPKGGAL